MKEGQDIFEVEKRERYLGGSDWDMGPGVSHLGPVPVLQLPVFLTKTKLIHFSELRFLPLWNGDDHLTSYGAGGTHSWELCMENVWR